MSRTTASRRPALRLAAAAGLLAAAASPALAEKVAEHNMLKYCQGEAAAQFNVSPRDITMKNLEKAKNGAHLAYGKYADPGSSSVQFTCRFKPSGEFFWVRTEETKENIKDANKGSGDGPKTSQIRACNAVEDRYGEVVESTALKPGAWEIILKYDDGNYVCNVEANNKVTYFEKLR